MLRSLVKNNSGANCLDGSCESWDVSKVGVAWGGSSLGGSCTVICAKNIINKTVNQIPDI